ncbi:MAG TPA: EAL domain-containing protein [Pyrinomonadaceae bacterium]|nr:EAL domain-containing protein [Pyrinomonadaceae bacterium]
MPSKRSLENLYIALLSPVAAYALGWAVYNFPSGKIDLRLGGLAIVTVFFSSFLRIQLPRTKIHVTTSDAAIILSFLWYGGEIAIILSVLETAFTSFSYRRQGGNIGYKTISVNILIAVVALFATTMIVRPLFGTAPQVMEGGDVTQVILLLAVMGFALFIFNSALVSLFFAAKTDKSVISVWTEYCLNALVMYLSGAVLAGFTAKAIQDINIFLFAAVCIFFATIYVTYRRYINDIKRTSAQAEQSERERAEQAERHVRELKHYVEQLETSSRELKQSHARFRHAAYHDALTELPNRNYFIDALRRLIEQKLTQPLVSYAVLFLDLNGFRKINDSLGHSVGDQLVKQVAGRLLKIQRKDSIVGRFSGDEFAIILIGDADERGATGFAEEVVNTISEPYILNSKQVFTSVSVGIAFGNLNYDEPEEILRDADIAMYYAKDHGKEYVVFDEKMHTRAVSLLEFETDLRYAVERNEFELHYQPIVDLRNLQLAGFEALVRWNHPTLGQIAPDRFIPICESTGLIVPMTLAILETACSQTVEWQRRFGDSSPTFVSVNISGVHFGNPALVEQIKAALQKTGLSPRSLKLEITETAIMENGENAVAMLREIKDLGVQLSIDDFGTGYSSLGYLQQFPIDTLKIDRVFVRSMEEGRQNGEIVRAVLALAGSLSLDVVAEGIESIHQYHQLRILSCDYGQGFLFSRPVPAAGAENLLSDPNRWQSLLAGGDFAIVNPDYESPSYQLH